MSYTVDSYSDALSDVLLEDILSLPEVSAARASIDARTSGSVYFTIPLTPALKAALKVGLNLDLPAVNSIPMRWIKGDTVPHIDTGARPFDKTYLMYLTDSQGELVLENDSYPIARGSGYVFSEGIHHETAGTGSEPRLLLGPMSEEGLAVGIFGITGPGNSTLYIRQNGSDIEYSPDQDMWNPVFWPCAVANSDTAAGTLKIEFITDITLNSSTFQYFVCFGTSDIQFGSTSLKEDGTRPIITIDGITDYPGLIQNGDEFSNGSDNIHIFNLEVRATGGSTLFSGEGDGAGWLVHRYFGSGVSNNYIMNCTSSGSIAPFCGGLVGSYAGTNGGNVRVIGCSSSGSIALGGGGLLAALTRDIRCESCWSTGVIGPSAGGIGGQATNGLFATNCYTEGAIGTGGGGILGENAGVDNNVQISGCYSRGAIGAEGGGIVGKSFANGSIENCYSTGNIAELGGGICGQFPTSSSISNCYTSGATVTATGYIIGDSTDVPANCYSEAANETSGWNSVNAATVLQGLPEPVIGTTWVATGMNQPYELYNMGYSPYSRNNIRGDFTLNRMLTYFGTGNVARKDMSNVEYTDEFDPNNFQTEFFPGMADFVDGNIVAGDKDEADRLIASYWDDLGNDVFDDWGYFYIYDVESGRYYFPLISPQNGVDGVLTTQTYNAFGRQFTIIHGWVAQGIFKFDVTVADNLPFRFGAYGNMGSDGDETTEDLTHTYTIGGASKTLYYRKDAEDGDMIERLFSYFIPKNAAQNTSQPYNVYYDGDDMSMLTEELTQGVTIYFAKSNDVKDWVVNDLKTAVGEGAGLTMAGNGTDGAIVSGRSYTILYKTVEDDTITIDPVTGVISTTVETVPGIYILYIRNTGSYNITGYTLTVGGEGEVVSVACCGVPADLRGAEYDIRNEVVIGNYLMATFHERRGVVSYADLMRMKLATR